MCIFKMHFFYLWFSVQSDITTSSSGRKCNFRNGARLVTTVSEALTRWPQSFTKPESNLTVRHFLDYRKFTSIHEPPRMYRTSCLQFRQWLLIGSIHRWCKEPSSLDSAEWLSKRARVLYAKERTIKLAI